MAETKTPVDVEGNFLNEHAKIARKLSKIDPSEYDFYNVKRGLRNADGTGVLVGLTEIGEVRGYILDEKDKVPVEGSLEYRGLNVVDITKGFINDKRFGFEETVYLLLFGDLPNAKQLEDFLKLLDMYRELSDPFIEIILKRPCRNIMNKLASSVLAAYAFDRNPEGKSFKTQLRQCVKLISVFPSMIAYGYQSKSHYYDRKSLFIHRPIAGMSTAENFLRLIRQDATFTRVEAEVLDLALVLHAEHGGGNNSTFTARVVSSTDTDIYSAVAASVGSLKGLKHGGANIKVVEMMDDIKKNVGDWGDDEEIAAYIKRILTKDAFDRTGLVYGIGHAVYTKSDPRAVIFKRKVTELVTDKNRNAEFELYQKIEALTPEVFRKIKNSDKVISANVDFYSGFVYDMLGIPRELYTAIFAMARIAGWSAHILEELISAGKIIRPAYKSVCRRREYTQLSERE